MLFALYCPQSAITISAPARTHLPRKLVRRRQQQRLGRAGPALAAGVVRRAQRRDDRQQESERLAATGGRDREQLAACRERHTAQLGCRRSIQCQSSWQGAAKYSTGRCITEQVSAGARSTAAAAAAPSSSAGTAWRWIGVGSCQPAAGSAARSRGPTWYRAPSSSQLRSGQGASAPDTWRGRGRGGVVQVSVICCGRRHMRASAGGIHAAAASSMIVTATARARR